MKKRLFTSQPEALSDEKFHGTAAPVGLLAFFHFVSDQGGPFEIITLYDEVLKSLICLAGYLICRNA